MPNPFVPRPMAAVLSIGLSFGLALLVASPLAAAPCAGSELLGSVFHDFDADGARSTGNAETGVPGAIVTAFSDDGTSAFCETLADGSFGLDAPSGGYPVRVEVTLPPGGIYDALEPGAAGPTTVVFATAPTSGLDIGLNVPVDYCQANPDVLTTCFLHGDPLTPGSSAADGDVVVSVDYDRTLPSADHIAFGSEVGAVWGVAYQRSSESAFVAAVLRRHAGFGPLGIGGIYRIDYSGGAPVVSPFLDVNTLGIAIGADPRGVPGEDPPGNGPTGNEPGLDNLAYEQIGKVGLGDIDIEEETGRLWAMSLGDATLYAMDLGAGGSVPSAATAFPLPAVACTDGVFRPWAVKPYRGRIYVGGVCSNELISPYPTPSGFIDFPNLTASVLSMDPADGVFSFELTVPLNYRKGCSGGSLGCQWYPWTDLSTASLVPAGVVAFPSPILSDLEFADDGDLILGFTDRSGLQYGVAAPAPNTTPTDTSIPTVFAGGDMLRADFDPVTTTFTLESNGSAGADVGAGVGNNQGPGGGEYYSATTAGFHFELSLGGYGVLRGSNHFVGASMDPATINSGGLLWMNEKGATPGTRFAGYTLYAGTTPPTFNKGVGIGDVEVLCEPAPIEIGNRVWCDAPVAGQLGNGVQNAGTPDLPLGGVTVDLSCNGGALVASTVTAGDGTYVFGPGNVAGGIPPGASCTVSIDTAQPALGDCVLPAPANAGGADPGGDLRDSDGTDPDLDGIVTVDVTIGGPGANDHSIDFGFAVAATIGSVGDTVWCDGLEGFNDGVFSAGEGISGVTVELFDDVGCNGTADGAAVATTSTSGDGQYLFETLLVGPSGSPVCYVVRVDGSDPDLAGCTLPITPTEDSAALDIATMQDLTLDFGFVEPCADPDGDRACNESCVADRDGDGDPDCSDVDPQGFLYCEETGEILSGGLVEIVGPGAVTVLQDGSSGRYAFLTDGTPGVYALLVTPPDGIEASTTCTDLGVFDPTGEANPLVLGAGEILDTGQMSSADCTDNPFFLAFDLEAGDPVILNNNIPFQTCRVPVIEVPTMSDYGLGLLALLLAAAGATALRRR
ncbi:MAG: IPTL-CTERM sorting domain-containing protein [Acidobacteriota bacterium]